MNYLFVMPSSTKIKQQSYVFPIGIAYVSASLKHTGRTVQTLNLNYKDGEVTELIRTAVLENKIDVIATGGLTAQYWAIKEIIDSAKKANPDIIALVGGGLITSDPVSAMEALGTADIGMVGEGEITICELADVLEKGTSLAAVNGIVYQKDHEWVLTDRREEIQNLDDIPYPDYEGFEFGEVIGKEPTDMFAIAGGHFAYVSFGRSCPFQCTFCFHPSGTKYRKRSLDSAFAEIDWLLERYDIKNIYVTDELFSRDMEYVKDFCQRIKQRNLGFMVQLRVDFITEELAVLLKESGCISALLGLESADNTVLKSMRKHITIEQIEQALKILYDSGLNAQGSFIFGDLAETKETAMRTIRWWAEHPQYFIKTTFITVYPGSYLYKIACERGIIKDKVQFIKDGCPYINVSKMTDTQYSELAELVNSLYAKSSDILGNARIEYTGYGKVTLYGECPECKEMNIWKNQDPFKPEDYIYCSHCNRAMNIVCADYLDGRAETYLQELIGGGYKIAVWPVKNAVKVMMDTIPSLHHENVYLVDSSKFKQGTLIEEKVVMPPDVIREEDIDVVILSITTPTVLEIIDEIHKQYPSVKKILYAGDLLG